MSIKITHEFSSVEAAMAHLEKMRNASQPPAQTLVAANKPPQQQPVQANADAKSQAQSSGAVSLDDVQNAFRAYLAKKDGRTAKTAMAILQDFGAIRDGRASTAYAKPEQYGALKAAFDVAGPENPLGKTS